MSEISLPLQEVVCILDGCLQGLSDQGYELVSTGGSAAALESASLPVQRVEQLTGFPEMLDGTLLTPSKPATNFCSLHQILCAHSDEPTLRTIYMQI